MGMASRGRLALLAYPELLTPDPSSDLGNDERDGNQEDREPGD